jgi:hypothetical protein
MKKCLCRSSVVGCAPRSCASAVAHLGRAQQACVHTFRWNRINARPLAMILFPCSRCCCHEGWLYTNSLGGSPIVAARGGEINMQRVGNRLKVNVFRYWLIWACRGGPMLLLAARRHYCLLIGGRIVSWVQSFPPPLYFAPCASTPVYYFSHLF